MTSAIAMAFAILLMALVLFVTEWPRMDLVALLVLSAQALSGLVILAEAFAGFSNPAVITAWATFIVRGFCPYRHKAKQESGRCLAST